MDGRHDTLSHFSDRGIFDENLVAFSPHDPDLSGLDAFRRAFPDVYQNLEVGTEIKLK